MSTETLTDEDRQFILFLMLDVWVRNRTDPSIRLDEQAHIDLYRKLSGVDVRFVIERS
jgi:hypothetical protein